jgi:predicted dehydrogenase
MNLNRRQFSALAGATLLSSALPNLNAQTDDKRIGYCIVGLGRISMDHFMPGVKMSSQSKITAIVSGHPDKARKMAAQYGVPENSIYTYETYDQIRDNKAIDAVYIALPNNMHAEYTIRAAKAGKHVLCEKPMCTSVADAHAMIDACKQAKVKLLIAYRCQYEPTNLRAISLIREGRLGTVQAIESANGFNIRAGEWRLNKKMAGGGPLLDVGIYSLNACRYLTAEEPVEVKAYSTTVDHDGRFDQVEENTSWTMKFPSGIVASCNTTYGADMNGFYRVHGSKGVLDVETAFPYQGQHLTAAFNDKTSLDEPNPAKDPSHFVRMADYFSNCIIKNEEPKTNGEEGLRDMEWISKIYESCGLSL